MFGLPYYLPNDLDNLLTGKVRSVPFPDTLDHRVLPCRLQSSEDTQKVSCGMWWSLSVNITVMWACGNREVCAEYHFVSLHFD